MSLNEFGIIRQYFKKNYPSRKDVILGSGDDCAIVLPPPGQTLVMTMDSLFLGRHFLASMDPADLAYKSIAVSLSDIAAMGAEPAWLLGSLSLEEAEPAWLERFSEGLSEVLETYGLALIGGDFTRGPLSVTIQMSGFVPPQQAITRSGAKVGDKIFVTGTLGDAGLALADLLGRQSLDPQSKALVYPRLNRPTPRIKEGLALRSIASAAIDISDGLIADLGHILEQSGIGAQVFLKDLPLSEALRKLAAEEALPLALSAGDDYELCFTLPPEKEAAMRAAMPKESMVTAIGQIVQEPGLTILQEDGSLYECSSSGYLHF